MANRGRGRVGGSLVGLLAPSLPLLLFLLMPCSSSPSLSVSDLSRDDFPPDFIFGAGTSAFQVEGAAHEDGRSPSVWDTFTHAGKMRDGSTADVTADGYHHYKEDVKRMSEIGLESYRFSISWPRVIPNGRGTVNPKGIEFYNNFIDELIDHGDLISTKYFHTFSWFLTHYESFICSVGIQPHVTLYHNDLPQVLEDEYGGWLSPKIIDDFVAYADVCFKEFGDRVSYWTTLNEPNIISIGTYDQGIMPPGRCSNPFGFFNCTVGNSTTEPYIAVHNFLLAHASVAELYRTKYKATQNGWIGINVYTLVFHPKTNSTADIQATQRAFDFFIGWILNPLIFGDYPEIMKVKASGRIPSFTESQSKLLKGSIDFYGLNYYATRYVSELPDSDRSSARDFFVDLSVLLSVSENSTSHEKFLPTPGIVDPRIVEGLLQFLKTNYGNLPVYIHENGAQTPYNVTINDSERIVRISTSIKGVLASIRNGSNCRGYFVWSFLDVFEILYGFQVRFGLYYVDFEDENRARQPKLSALWYRDFLKRRKNLTAF